MVWDECLLVLVYGFRGAQLLLNFPMFLSGSIRLDSPTNRVRDLGLHPIWIVPTTTFKLPLKSLLYFCPPMDLCSMGSISMCRETSAFELKMSTSCVFDFIEGFELGTVSSHPFIENRVFRSYLRY